MKLLVLDGNPEDNEYIQRILCILETAVQSRAWNLEIIPLRENTMAYCRGCFGCWTQSPGECVIKDDAPIIDAKIIQSDVVVYFTPLTFGAYSPLLKNQLDRSICLVHPYFTRVHGEIHHKKRYSKYPSILGIALLDQADNEIESLFHRNIQRNAINLHSPSFASEIVYYDQSDSEISATIDAGLANLEVV